MVIALKTEGLSGLDGLRGRMRDGRVKKKKAGQPF